MPSTLRAHRRGHGLGVNAAALVCLGTAFEIARAQETIRVSVDSSGNEPNLDACDPSASFDGRIVAFWSYASNLVSNDWSGWSDVFVHDSDSGLTEIVSVDSSGNYGVGSSSLPSISADGRVVSFVSFASNLVGNDTNGCNDIFVHDRSTGLTERVSVDSSGTEGNDWSGYLTGVSSDGQIVVFSSWASNLVPGDKNWFQDVFVHDRSTGLTERVSVDSSGREGNGHSIAPSTSRDGRFVTFQSAASNLVSSDANGHIDTFIHDRSTGLTERVSVDSSSAEGNDDSAVYAPAGVSDDGRFVVFSSVASNLVAGDTNGCVDVFVRDRSSGTTERVSVDSSGAQGSWRSDMPSISADGNVVAFESDASNLVANDTNACRDIFTRNRSVGLTERRSVDSSGNQSGGQSYNSVISGGGFFVAFRSNAQNLVANDNNSCSDVFVQESCSMAATWSNYGAGFAGTNGVPSFTAEQNPSFGSTVTLDLANSYAMPTTGLMLIGYQRTDVPTNRGGDLLVLPALTMVMDFWYGGNTFSGTIPRMYDLCGVTIDLQALEADPGAAKGMSFTMGLELVIGN